MGKASLTSHAPSYGEEVSAHAATIELSSHQKDGLSNYIYICSHKPVPIVME